MGIELAISEIEQQVGKPKYEAMVNTAAIITKLLEENDDIQPIVVGGLSVEIYTQREYATRDIDFVSDGYEKISVLLSSLGFVKDGRHFYHPKIEIAIEIPDSCLAGDYNKVVKVMLDEDKYVYLISIEDIILDRLRAAVWWKSEQDSLWGFKLLAGNQDVVDFDYIDKNFESEEEKIEFDTWLEALKEPSVL
ncbi:hypothetical protein B1R38_06075 [Bacillus cereus]|uniref:DUF6036 family nucleotidyltransferase n=1 Tax=Bacillus cereus TaxID=1396 RepID=UPI000D642D3E|nr:DUF6036 family nucleotidyltransferase [Bacillus cereus]PWE74349.1 hypothetical protein B1R38_06075 [Bacillus cereus]